MRLVALGDTHGRSDWKEILMNETFDKVIFIGDYFDTHENITPQQQKNNFRDILAYKKDSPDKVVLLFGNHDFHYLPLIDQRYSGYQPLQQIDIQELLQPAIKEGMLQMCYAHEDLLFSHAGVTQTWYRKNLARALPVDKAINDLFRFSPNAFRFTPGKYRSPTGDEVEQSPIWVRPNSLMRDRIDGYIQVVGHTVQDRLLIHKNGVFIDTIGTSGQYLIWDSGQISIGRQASKIRTG